MSEKNKITYQEWSSILQVLNATQVVGADARALVELIEKIERQRDMSGPEIMLGEENAK